MTGPLTHMTDEDYDNNKLLDWIIDRKSLGR